MPDVQAARITIPVISNADGTTASMASLNKALKNAGIEVKKTGKEVNKTGKALTDLKGIAKQLIPVLGFAGLTKVLTSSVQAASDLEESTNKFLVTFKEVPEQAKKIANELVNAYGWSKQESVALLSATGDLLTGFGFTGKAALDLSSQVQTLAADLASFQNLEGGVKQASEALTKGLLGEREMLKSLGIVVREADVKSRLMAQGLDKLTGTALLQAKAQVTMQIALEQSKNAYKDAINTAGSYANVSRRVGSRITDLSATLGKNMLPALANAGQAFLALTKDGGVLAQLLEILGRSIGGMIDGLTNLMDIAAMTSDEFQANLNQKALNQTIARMKELKAAGQRGSEEYKKLSKRVTELANANFSLSRSMVDSANRVESTFDREKEALKKVKNAAQTSAFTTIKGNNGIKKSIEDINKARKEALSILAATGDLSSQLALQEMQFAEQKKAVAAAGLNVAQLEQFQAQQRLNAVKNFITQSVEAEKGGILAKQEALNEAYFMALENDALSWEQKLAAQQAYNDASISLEQQRAREIAATTQLIGQGALQVSGILSAISQVRQNEMQQEIMNMEAAGASQEELDKKRKQLAKKAAKDQKKFGIISVIINTAMAVTKALASVPPPASYVLAAISAAAGLAQLAVIQSQPVPAQFGGSFVVPPGNEADSGLLRVNQGEEVSVTPVRETEQGGPKQITVMIDNRQFDAYLIDKMNQNLNNGSVQITRGGIVKTA